VTPFSSSVALDPETLREALNRRAAGRGGGESAWWPILCMAEIPSTQGCLSALERAGVPAGAVVIASAQTGGRGRRGRRWHSPPSLGLYASALMRPAEDGALAVRWSLAAAIAACEALRELGAAAEIKWPNDLVVGGRKAGGLLVETRTEAGRLRAVLIGCGVNVAQRVEDFPEELRLVATSIAIETGTSPTVGAVATALLGKIEETAGWMRACGTGALLDRWRDLSPASTGTAVTVLDGDAAWEGITRGIGDDGALAVEGADGRLRRLGLGEEIRVRPRRS